MNEQNDSGFEAITMDGGPFDSLSIEKLEDGSIKLSIDRDAVVWQQHARATMCAEDVARLAEWLAPTRDNALAAMTARAEQAEAKLAAVPWELIRTVARGALNFNFVPAVDIVKVLSWVDDNDA